MAFDSKILLAKIKNLRARVDGIDFSDVFSAALNTGNAVMQQRIFIENKDVEGNSFGTYIGEKKFASQATINRLLSKAIRTDRVRIRRAASLALTPYQRKRANKGRQVTKKDLEFESTLRNSIEIQVLNEKAVALMFNNDKSVLVARGQENQITNIRNGGKGYVTGDGIKIFGFNDDERGEVNNQVRLLVAQKLKP